MIYFLKGDIAMKRFVLTIAILTINSSCVAMDKNSKTVSMAARCFRNRTTLLFSLTGVASILALRTVMWCTVNEDKAIINTDLEKYLQTDNDNKPFAHPYPQSHDHAQIHNDSPTEYDYYGSETLNDHSVGQGW
jgi:hypothetical protein